MDLTPTLNKWRIAGASVRGSSHNRNNKPNQDFLDYCPRTDDGYPYIAVLSDGHGSAKSFRSDVGSKSAVTITMNLLRNLISDELSQNIAEIERRVITELIPQVVRQWNDDVIQNLNRFPVTQEEITALKEKDNASLDINNILQKNPAVIYGSTLLAVAVARTYSIFLRIGDGDILGVDIDGSTRDVLPKDSELIGVETTSLCEADAIKKFRSKVVSRADYDPVMFLVSTDGYSTSFESPEGFFDIGKDYLNLVRNFGIRFVHEQLPDFLGATSKKGSGDDISLGVLKRAELMEIDTVLEVAKLAAKIEVKFVTENIASLRQALENAKNKAEKLSNYLAATISEKEELQKTVDEMEKKIADLQKAQNASSFEEASQFDSMNKQMENLHRQQVFIEGRIDKLDLKVDEHKKATSSSYQVLERRIQRLYVFLFFSLVVILIVLLLPFLLRA